jgi:hypothetical protein
MMMSRPPAAAAIAAEQSGFGLIFESRDRHTYDGKS